MCESPLRLSPPRAASSPGGVSACGSQAIYGGYRIYLLWDTFSNWHAAGFALTTTVYAASYYLFSASASPKYAPLKDGGKLISAGTDLNQSGLIECARECLELRRLPPVSWLTERGPGRRYTWDLLYTTMFVQLMTAFVSDWFWLLYLVPPSIGFYFLWTKVRMRDRNIARPSLNRNQRIHVLAAPRLAGHLPVDQQAGRGARDARPQAKGVEGQVRKGPMSQIAI